jgi:hypothetical protein
MNKATVLPMINESSSSVSSEPEHLPIRIHSELDDRTLLPLHKELEVVILAPL